MQIEIHKQRQHCTTYLQCHCKTAEHLIKGYLESDEIRRIYTMKILVQTTIILNEGAIEWYKNQHELSWKDLAIDLPMNG